MFGAFCNESGDGASLEASSIVLSPDRFAFKIFVGAFDWSDSFGRVFFLELFFFVDSFFWTFVSFTGSTNLTAGNSRVLPVSESTSE